MLLHKLLVAIDHNKHKDLKYIKVALKLLILQYYQRIDEKHKGGKYKQQIKQLTTILAPIFEHDISYYNSVIWAIITDPGYFYLTQEHRLAMVCSLI